MVSYGPDSQSYLFTHMFSFVDYRKDTPPELCIDKDSVYGFIHLSPSLSKFRQIIQRANMNGFLNDIQANVTLFVPTDEALSGLPDGYIDNMDDGLARQIVAASTLPQQIDRHLLTSSPVCYLYTKNPEMRMYVTNINSQTRLNNCATVTRYDIIRNNGIIHLVDTLIAPSQYHFMN